MFFDILSGGDNIYWQRLWFSIVHDLTKYHSTFNSKNDFIRPGEIAFAKGVVISDFYAFIEKLGYTLTADEKLISTPRDGNMPYVGKPVVILKRLGSGQYIVCRSTSWGGHAKIEDIHFPLHKYFAFSASEYLGDWPRGVKPLRFTPSTRRSEAFMMIPVVKNDVRPSYPSTYRTFLSIGQLERIETLTNLRMKIFPSVVDQLRKSTLEIQMLRRNPQPLWPAEFREKFVSRRILKERFLTSPSSPKNIVTPLHLRWINNRIPFISLLPKGVPVPVIVGDRNPPRLHIPKQTNLINWVYRRAVDDLIDSDFHMDPPKPLGKNVDYREEEHRYGEPCKRVKSSDSKTLFPSSRPMKSVRGGPLRSFRSSRTFHFFRKASIPFPLL